LFIENQLALASAITAEMLQAVHDFVAEHKLDLKLVKLAFTTALQAWPPELDMNKVQVVTIIIMERILRMHFWMDQFPKPPIDEEAKARDGPYCDSYRTEEKE
jgi:hypothetical protein